MADVIAHRTPAREPVRRPGNSDIVAAPPGIARMDLVIDIVVVLLLIGLNGLLSLSELALVSANRTRLTVMERKGIAGAARARALAEEPQHFLPTIQVGITLIGILTGVFGGARIADRFEPLLAQIPLLQPVAPSLAVVLVVLVMTYFTMVLGELVPKQLALRRPEELAAHLVRPLSWLLRVFAPVVTVLAWSSGIALRLFGAHRAAPQTVTEEELKAILAEGEETGVLESEERGMIERVLRLADKPVRAIMTPRNEIAWLDRTDSARDIASEVKAAPHGRIVVCDGTIDNVVGVVVAKDLLDRILDGKELSIAAVLRQPIVMPDTVTALDALERLKTDPLGLALVLDEYGSFEGVVTAADVLQAIVGAERRLRGRSPHRRRAARGNRAVARRHDARGRVEGTAGAARFAGGGQLPHAGGPPAGAAASGAARRRSHRLRRLAVRGHGHGQPPRRPRPRQPRSVGGRVI